MYPCIYVSVEIYLIYFHILPRFTGFALIFGHGMRVGKVITRAPHACMKIDITQRCLEAHMNPNTYERTHVHTHTYTSIHTLIYTSIHAYAGGAIRSESSRLIINGALDFVGNLADEAGGAIHLSANSKFSSKNYTSFYGNLAGSYGGAWFVK
jgi:hypothetical protein